MKTNHYHQKAGLMAAVAALCTLGTSANAAVVLASLDTQAQGWLTVTGISITMTTGVSWRAAANSTDGTFGASLKDVNGADADTATTGALRVRDDNTEEPVVTLTNNAGTDLSLEGIFFDLQNLVGGGITMTYESGDLSGVTGGAEIGVANPTVNTSAAANYPDFNFDLTALADSTLAAGQSATFKFNVVTIGNQNLLDNIAFTGTIGAIPEPSAALLGGLGLLALLRRRR